LKQLTCEIENEQYDWIESQLAKGNYVDTNQVIRTALGDLVNECKQPLLIPREKISEGIGLCKDNALNFLKCAELLVKSGLSNYSIILFQYAKEEIGKFTLLKEQANQLGEKISLPAGTFSDHLGKDSLAEGLLGKDSWLIRGGFEDSGFQIFSSFKGFEKPLRTNHKIRLKCAFVDYDEGQNKWVLGVEHSPETLLAKINEVKSKLNEL
jgi:AbiV family abortive infection protein